MTDDLVNIETFEFVQDAEAARDLLEVALAFALVRWLFNL